MSTLGERVREFSEQLATERDELRVQIHLAKSELNEEWEQAEKKWRAFRGKADVMMDEAADVSKDTFEAVKLLGDELRRGYQRIRKTM